MSQRVTRDRNVIATFVISVVIVALFLATYFRSADVIRARSVRRMEEGVDTVIGEVVSKIERDSNILNAAADMIATVDLFDEAATLEVIETIAPLLETMDICVLLPDNRILQPAGSVVDGAGHLDFATEAALGEHVSSRVTSVDDGQTLVLRHFVPLMQDGEVAALLYGRTRLEALPAIMNIDQIYNASADVYIIDAATGEFLMDTRHETLGTLDNFPVGKMRGSVTWEGIKAGIMHLQSGYAIYQAEDGEWLNFYYTPAGINRWAIAVSVPEEEALETLYAMEKVFFVTAIMMAVAIVLYALWMQNNARLAMNDAVERAVLEEKLHKAEAAEKAKTTFLSNMSHDIRTPMNAITGFATLARRNMDNRERVEEYLEKILSSGNYLLSLINDVLDMSRIESGKLNIDEKPCAISEIFHDMRNIIQTQMQSKQLSFFMDTMDVTDEDIYCDKLHVNQVLLNLLSNAIKFTPAGGSVYLSIRQLPEAPAGYGNYEIRVKDTGIGMNPAFVEHIFEPFERERNTTISGIQGTGLGMAITKNIVDAMGGTIQVETEEGKGTEFIICLAFRLQDDHRQAEISPILEGKRALVVDDNFITCDSVTKILTQLGMQASWSMHGKEAVLRTRQALEMGSGFDACIVDWTLPDLSGLEVVRQIRAIAGDEVTIVVMTAYDWASIEEEARQAGVNAFCSKPVFPSNLREILESNEDKRQSVADGDNALTVEDALLGKRLLLVEDNELNREIAEELLTESGFVIESAEDGSIAVEKVQNAEVGWYDLILMDIQMPVMNGHEATRAIRALPDRDKARIPIVAMTANAFEEDRQHALACGMNDYVAKPINLEELLGVIQNVIKASQS